MKYIYLFTFISMSLFSFAQDELPSLISDRPTQTESARLIPTNSFQVETGFTNHFVTKEVRSYDIGPTLLRFSYFDQVEFRFIYNMNKSSLPTARDEKAINVDPFQLGVKLKLLEKEKFQMSFSTHLAIQHLATKGNRPDKIAPHFRFAFNHNINDWYSIGYNIGASFDGYNDSPAYLYTLVHGFSITDKLGAFVEVYGDVSTYDFPHHSLDMGFTYLIHPNLQLDVEGGFGLTDVSENGFIGVGLVWRKLNLR